jgi:hypothetical protein
MKIKIDLNFDLLDLNNTSLGLAGKMLAGLLMSEMKGDAIKLFDWAMSFNSTGIIEVDNADLVKLTDLINATDRMSIMAKGPIVRYLNTLKK